MSEDRIVGVILAGGQGRRMGGQEKFALKLAGQRLLDIAARRLDGQVERLVVASNREVGAELQWCRDIFEGSMGPLAGLHAAFIWARQNLPAARLVASIPVDCPLFPLDLVERLAAAGAPSFARDKERSHPIFGLWPLDLEVQLHDRLAAGRRLAIEDFAADVNAKAVEFEAPNAFFNINRKTDLEEAGRLLSASS